MWPAPCCGERRGDGSSADYWAPGARSNFKAADRPAIERTLRLAFGISLRTGKLARKHRVFLHMDDAANKTSRFGSCSRLRSRAPSTLEAAERHPLFRPSKRML